MWLTKTRKLQILLRDRIDVTTHDTISVKTWFGKWKSARLQREFMFFFTYKYVCYYLDVYKIGLSSLD